MSRKDYLFKLAGAKPDGTNALDTLRSKLLQHHSEDPERVELLVNKLNDFASNWSKIEDLEEIKDLNVLSETLSGVRTTQEVVKENLSVIDVMEMISPFRSLHGSVMSLGDMYAKHGVFSDVTYLTGDGKAETVRVDLVDEENELFLIRNIADVFIVQHHLQTSKFLQRVIPVFSNLDVENQLPLLCAGKFRITKSAGNTYADLMINKIPVRLRVKSVFKNSVNEVFMGEYNNHPFTIPVVLVK